MLGLKGPQKPTHPLLGRVEPSIQNPGCNFLHALSFTCRIHKHNPNYSMGKCRILLYFYRNLCELRTFERDVNLAFFSEAYVTSC